MSDPVSNHDIEDVLSSIRRLVAQGNAEDKQQTRPEPPILRDVADNQTPDRLVLTPAFRVEDDADDSAQAQNLQSPPMFTPDAGDMIATGEDEMPEPAIFWTEDTPTPRADTSDRASLEATIAELEAAVTEAPDEWEPDGSEDSLENGIESSVTSAFLHKLDARNAKSPEQTVTDAVTDHIADTIAEEIADAIPFEDATFAKSEANVTPDADALGTDDPADEIIAEIVEPATVEEPTFAHAPFEEVYDPVAEATADAAEQEPGDVYGDELAPDEDAAFGPVGAPAAGGQLVDPDALRVLVGEMIREELQGEMGERITRNVRKLVRREINRVITEQDV